MMYQVIYIPRMEDEICVGEYKTQMEAEQHLKQIKLGQVIQLGFCMIC